MVTNKERKNAANNLRDTAKQIEKSGGYSDYYTWMSINDDIGIDWDCDITEITLRRIADLIDPANVNFMDDLENICEWAYYNMEGCDEPEWSLFSGLYGVITEYVKKTSL